MTFFLPSFFQKRILRYALSRLELLDTDALDLEKLDIVWGKRSTVELRDVGVHTKKLADLLQLPGNLVIVSAQLLHLRLTIPADLYKSGILVEVQGVQARVNANLEDQGGGGKPKSTPPKRGFSEEPSKSVKTDRLRNTQSHVHDPGGGFSKSSSSAGGDGHAGVSGYLPNTIDLAKSFLHDEPKEEKAELKDAIAQSQYLHQSLATGDDGDETSDLGVANTLSLPGFLADFLKGVGDRVQVEVKHVELDLDMKLGVTSENAATSDSSERSNVLTIRFYIEHITVNAITRLATQSVTEQDSVQEASKSGSRETRRITLTKFQTMLISDASLFANFARSTGPSSPETTHASIILRSGSKPIESPVSSTNAEPRTKSNPLPASIDRQDSEDSEASLINAFSQGATETEISDTENGFNASLGLSDPGDSQYRDSALTGSFYSASGDTPRLYEERKDSENLPESFLYGRTAKHGSSAQVSTTSRNFVDAASLEGGRTPPGTFDAFPPTSSFPAGNSQTKLGFDTRSRGFVLPPESPAKPQDPNLSMGIRVKALPPKPSSPGSDTISLVSDDLAQSKIFSHEEAESMYMSAISHVSAPRTDKGTSIPGQWSASSSDSSDAGRYSFVTGDLSTLQEKQTGISHHLETPTNGIGLASHHGDHGRQIPRILNPESTESMFTSSRLPPDVRHEPVSPHRFSDQRNGSSQGSEASSANLKSPFTTMKRILSVDSIALEFSQGNVSSADSPIGTKYQSSAALSQTLSRNSEPTSHISYAAPQEIPFLGYSSHSQQSDRQPSIDIGEIQVFSDIGLARLTILVIEKMNTMRSSSSSENNRTAFPQPPPREVSQVRLNVKRMCWKFLDVVKGVPVRGAFPQNPVQQADLCGDSEVLLRAEMQEFHAMYHNSGPSSGMEVSARKFSFGYVSDDILSFDSGLKMRESTRDILAPTDNDVKLMLTRTVGATSVELTTLPLHIALDSRRLDETFAWFGGISSMLGLGSSMMSTMTVVDLGAKSSHSRPVRAVHFEGQEHNDPKPAYPFQRQNKVTARIGGLVLDIQGTRSSLRLESTAMKLVSRTEGLGLQVDRLNITGPYLQDASSEPSTAVKLSNLRIEYLSTPKEKDLDRLLALLSPSKDEYERDDDILLDTLLRQRRQGGVVRATVESLEGTLSDLDDLQCFAALSEDLKKLSTVTKYLPEDDRPGFLTLMLVREIRLRIQVNDSFGAAILALKDFEAAYVAFPSLVALGITTLKLHRNEVEELVGHALPMQIVDEAYSPMVMARFIGNEMEPTAKIKLYNVRFEYHVPTLLAVMGMKGASSVESTVADMVSSVATLTTRGNDRGSTPKLSSQGPVGSDRSQGSKELRLHISLRDSILGLNPRKSQAKGLVVFTDTHFVSAMPRGKEADALLDIRKASIMVIDDRDNVSSTAQSSVDRRSQVEILSDLGYVSVSLISAGKVTINVLKLENDSSKAIDVEIRDDLFVLESCADSTQTLQTIIAGLTPPTPPCTGLKYRTEVIPVEDMLASFSGDAFPATQISHVTDEDVPLGLDEGEVVDDEVPQKLEFVSSLYNPDLESVYEGIADSMLEDDLESLSSSSIVRGIGDKDHLESLEERISNAPDDSPLDFRDDHFGTSSVVGGTVHQRNTQGNTYTLSNEFVMRDSPLRVRVRDVHFIWNLYDGYDWKHTRDTISQAVEDVKKKATERLARNDKRKAPDSNEEEGSVISDFLFNSIYIGIPANRDPRELAHQVNRNVDDIASETESYVTSTSSGSPSRTGQVPRSRGSRKLRLRRSKYHKMTFELKGVSADMIVFPPDSGDTQNSLDIKVQDLEIFDHVPTSTWKKFATYMHEAGERESGTSMIHLEILNVKPVPNLAASEIILKATILPLRLHVDQDALDFMTRFFEFKDNSAPMQTSKSEAPFLQRVEVNSIRVKFDFKPKRVDYAGIRSGRTNEFMNFFILEQADMILRHVIIYGVSGFDKLGKTLNDIWMPDVKGNQLPGVLAGLAPIRSLVNVGGGFRNLVAIPIREYRKDGRVVRSLQKGAVAFAKTTTSELVKLGAKLAIGTQTVLQGAEDLLTQPVRRSDVSSGWEDAELEAEEKPQISAYADPPVGVVQGLRGGYASLERDLLTAKDAIIAMPGEILESGTAGGVARAVLRGAPTIILRPAMGVSNALGQTLMGATNSLDPGNRRRIEDKYKRH
ncbi:MAG: autophagy- protein 2 [Alectoria sarmentosa]|nr:MAG: autophagy- protein 2 [Alectoria sarmentosa]